MNKILNITNSLGISANGNPHCPYFSLATYYFPGSTYIKSCSIKHVSITKVGFVSSNGIKSFPKTEVAELKGEWNSQRISSKMKTQGDIKPGFQGFPSPQRTEFHR